MDEADVPDLAAMLADPRLVGRRRLGDDRPVPRSPSAISEVLRRSIDAEHGITFVIDDGQPRGLALASWWWDAMTPDVAVVVGPEHRRRGLGHAAAVRLLRHVFTTGPALVVQADVPSWDADALTFAESLGAERIGVHRRTGIRDGRYHDDVAFALTRDRWEERHGAHG